MMDWKPVDLSDDLRIAHVLAEEMIDGSFYFSCLNNAGAISAQAVDVRNHRYCEVRGFSSMTLAKEHCEQWASGELAIDWKDDAVGKKRAAN